jgi:hypothetical protein
MRKIPRLMGAALVLLALAVSGAPKLIGTAGTTTKTTPTNASFDGMPAVDFNWSY